MPFFAVTPQGMYDYAIDKYVPVRFFDYIHSKWSTTTPPANLEFPVGNYAPAAGLTYLQIGRAGLGLAEDAEQRRRDSRARTVDHRLSPLRFARSRRGARGELLRWHRHLGKRDRVAGPERARLSERWTRARSHNSRTRPIANTSPTARKRSRPSSPMDCAPRDRSPIAAKDLPDVAFELHAKQDQFEHALAESLGLQLDAAVVPEREPQGRNPFGGAAPTFTIAIPGQAFRVGVDLLNQSPENVTVDAVTLAASDGKAWKLDRQGDAPKALAGRAQAQVKFTAVAPADAALTRPYYGRPDEEQAYYDLIDPRYRNLSMAPYPLSASAELSYHGVPIHLAEVVQSYQRIPTLGVVAQPLIVGPAISVTLSPSAGAVPVGTKSFAFSCTVHSNVKGPAEGTLRLQLPAGWRSVPDAAPFTMARDGEDHTITFSVEPNGVKPGEQRITAVAEYKGTKYEEGYRLVGYPGIRPYPLYRAAIYRAVGVDVKTAPGLHIGYLPGTGDDVPTALENLGVNVRTWPRATSPAAVSPATMRSSSARARTRSAPNCRPPTAGCSST